MSTTVTLVLTLISNLAPLFTNSAQVQKVIETLTTIVEEATAEIIAITPYIKNIITALTQSGLVTADQMKQLQDLDASTDAAFEAAAAADGE